MVHFYGVGGAGKIQLLLQLREDARAAGLPAAYLNLEVHPWSDPALKLARIARELGVECPRFDLALAWVRYREGEDHQSPEFWGSHTRLGGTFLLELLEALGEGLAERGEGCRAVLFLDSFEALRGGLNAAATESAAYWVHDLCVWNGRLGPLLVVVAGRDRLRWSTWDSDWAREEWLEQRLVGGLSEATLGDRTANLRRAIEHYEVALTDLDGGRVCASGRGAGYRVPGAESLVLSGRRDPPCGRLAVFAGQAALPQPMPCPYRFGRLRSCSRSRCASLRWLARGLVRRLLLGSDAHADAPAPVAYRRDGGCYPRELERAT